MAINTSIPLPLHSAEHPIFPKNGKGVRPFLKWAGGKTQLLPTLLQHVPGDYGKYIEPMVGAGALFFYLRPKTAILGDLNEELINCYKVLRDTPNELITKLRPYRNSESLYYAVRNQDITKLSPEDRAARMIFLNKTCFNGLYRVNKKGDFNVPFGKLSNPTICDEPNLWACHEVLQGSQLICADYKDVIRNFAQPGDFVYIDPPYFPVGGHADFKRYTKEFFYEDDHLELRDEFCRLIEQGCWAMLTNSNTEFVRKLYDGFPYEVIDTRRNISSKASTRTGQDLVVIASRKPEKTVSHYPPHGNRLLEHFPGTRYMGSKYAALPFIWKCVKGLKFETVLDAFSGSSCVSYMFKQYGKQVISNDFMHFAYHFAKALVENSNCTLDSEDIAILTQPNPMAGSFVTETFRNLYFPESDNQFLDSFLVNVQLLKDDYKKSLALAAVSRACLKRQPRGIFTFVGNRYNDGRRDLQIDLKQHFLENVAQFNKAIFDNTKPNMALNSDVFDLDLKVDLVYLDPPYYTPNSDNDYTRRYHFVEGLVRNWNGVQIQKNTKTKKFKKYDTPFASKNTIYSAFDRLFSRFQDSILVVSYSSNSIPTKGDLVQMLKNYKSRVAVFQVDHLYSFGTHSHKIGNNSNRVKEYVFVGYEAGQQIGYDECSHILCLDECQTK